jgi:putative endonuclease
MWYTYILECKDGRLYAGITDNLKRRLAEHKSGKGANFTRSFGAKAILYKEKCSDRSSALKREAQIKGLTRKKKLALIAGSAGIFKKF